MIERNGSNETRPLCQLTKKKCLAYVTHVSDVQYASHTAGHFQHLYIKILHETKTYLEAGEKDDDDEGECVSE